MRALLLAIALACAPAAGRAAAPGTWTARIAVDQFGYTSDLPKVAVISSPQTGFNAGQSYTPGSVLEVREWVTNTVVVPVPSQSRRRR